MICVCGHSDDLHVIVGRNVMKGIEYARRCTACLCNEFVEDIDRDELEVE